MKDAYTKFSISILVIATVLLCLITISSVYNKATNNWQGVPPAIVDDDVYYYGRMVDIAQGHPFLGNPYFIEYRDSLAPAFFFSDWINAAPLLIAIPLIPAIVLNFIFWSLIYSLLVYLIARKYIKDSRLSTLVGVVAFSEVYWLILRPVSMQVVFPAFLFFLLSLILWLDRKESKPRILFLIISSSLSFYLYTYLWQIVVVILGLFFLFFVYKKQWKALWQLVLIGLSTIVISIPLFIYTFKQLGAQYYWETFERIGLVATHFPSIYAYQYGRWTIVLLVAYFLMRRLQVFSLDEGSRTRPEILVLIFSGLALLIMSLSNVVTGKELEIALHIGRFITLWVAIFAPILFIILWQKKLSIFKEAKTHKLSAFLLAILILLLAGFLLSNLRRSLPFSHITNENIEITQSYAAPFHWLNDNATSSVVIWANEPMSVYVPIMTNHYVLWNHLGILHLMPSNEAEDRFLLGWIGTSTSRADLLAHFREYKGTGKIWKYTDEYYKNKVICIIGLSCQKDKLLGEWLDPEIFKKLQDRQVTLKKDLQNSLRKFKVSYVIANKNLGEDKYFETMNFMNEVWSNDEYVIYKIL